MTRPGQHLLAPAFPDDRGAEDPDLACALSSYRSGGSTRTDVLHHLAVARVFVPASATALRTAESSSLGARMDKEAEMALVTLTGLDGRRALPIFTSADSFAGWRDDLRPVPVEGARAARTALDDGASALLVDVGRPDRFVVTGPELDQLALVWDTSQATDDSGGSHR